MISTVNKHAVIFRDPSAAAQGEEAWRVWYDGKLCSPDFNSQGAAAAYVSGLQRGRKPEYVSHDFDTLNPKRKGNSNAQTRYVR